MAIEQAYRQQNPDYEPPRRVGVEEYLRLSEELPGTYEYYDGLMYPRAYPPGSHWAMSGGTRAHARLIVSMVALLETHLRGGPCNLDPSDMRLYVNERTYFHPDAFVVCNEDTEPGRIDERDAVLVMALHHLHGGRRPAPRQRGRTCAARGRLRGHPAGPRPGRPCVDSGVPASLGGVNRITETLKPYRTVK